MTYKNPLTCKSIHRLNSASRELFNEVGIHRRHTVGRAICLTQHSDVGTSFEFLDDPEPRKEYHVPARMIPAIFV